MPHETLLKFQYPDTLLREYEYWAVLLRPKQVTLGSLVLVCTADATSMAHVSAKAFAELHTVTSDLEGVLREAFTFDKINYLLLMMVDKHVHFHIIPKFSESADGSGLGIGWPAGTLENETGKRLAADIVAALDAG